MLICQTMIGLFEYNICTQVGASHGGGVFCLYDFNLFLILIIFQKKSYFNHYIDLKHKYTHSVHTRI